MRQASQYPRWAFSAFLMLLFAMPAVAQTTERTPKPLSFETPYADGPVFVIEVNQMIDNALARYINRALKDAEAANAALVIFHLDTFGGLVDAADQIRKDILNATMPTVAFIDKNAASAGALISYAANRIVMVPGSSIGAATVVQGESGEAAPDKYQSYMRGLMRATAEANGRDPYIAEAMVDQTLAVEGISEAGKVLTLSAQEALQWGVADAMLGSLDEVVVAFGAENRERVAHAASPAELVLRFLGSPVLQSILMMMLLGGLYFELQTPGVGFPGMMAALGAVLFFAPHYMLGLVESWEIVVFIIGVALLLAEIFLIPGFGLAGGTGLLLIFGSLIAGMVGNIGFSFPPLPAIAPAISTLAVTVILLTFAIMALGRYLPHSERFSQLVLKPTLSKELGYTAADTAVTLLGQQGVAMTPLRPAGMANINGERIDVTTRGEFIEVGTPVRVAQVRGNRIEVRALTALPTPDETSPA